ncbi:hypothetical protein HWV62_21132 [Athelia sp. TMB]|nr:hypothetical protein HWV62_12332 [Athelia sp. TMB]KAF7983553.1 hypothetical protein HWV62_21132 [Athelia sp. TMB]
MHKFSMLMTMSAVVWASIVEAQTNLPPVASGVFNASTRIEINAPIDVAWQALLDFPSYPNWNPFGKLYEICKSGSVAHRGQVRSQVVTDDLYVPLKDQTPKENLRLIIQVQIPPLTPPVTSSTPPNPLNSQVSLENITHVQPSLYRVAWKQSDIPQLALTSERWSALSVMQCSGGTNVTLYESREVYDGPLAYAVEGLYGNGLQEGFTAQGVAFKALLEGSS